MNDIELSRAQRDCCATGSASTAQRPSTSNWSSLTPNFRRLYRQRAGAAVLQRRYRRGHPHPSGMERAYPEEMDLKRSINTAYRRRRSIKPCIHHGYNGDSFSISRVREGKPCRLSPIYPPFLTSSQKLARRAFSPSWILKSRTYRWWALTAPLCPGRSPWRRAPLSSRCAQPPMKPSRKRKRSPAQPLPAYQKQLRLRQNR